MKTFLVFLTSLCLALPHAAPAQEPAAVPAASASTAAQSQEELEAAFKSALTPATFVGRWCGIKNGALTPEREEKYHIVNTVKTMGDNWLINARMQYGGREIVAPIPVQVKWAGDTAVICVTDLSIPGGGTYSARVLVYHNTYAGTWSGNDGKGGLISGIIAKSEQ